MFTMSHDSGEDLPKQDTVVTVDGLSKAIKGESGVIVIEPSNEIDQRLVNIRSDGYTAISPIHEALEANIDTKIDAHPEQTNNKDIS